jgi:hypothetical protein
MTSRALNEIEKPFIIDISSLSFYRPDVVGVDYGFLFFGFRD